MKRVRISSIAPIRRGSFPISRKNVTLYRRLLREDSKPPPLLLGAKLPDGRWQLFDGRHRLRAAILEGRKTVEVFVMVRGA